MSRQTIWKYNIPLKDEPLIVMQQNAKILAVHTQRDVPCLWALVDAESSTEVRRFRLRGTGHDANGINADKYVGTFLLYENELLVFHLFEA